MWGDLLGGHRGVGVPVLARQHPRARQQGRGGLGPPDWPTDHVTSLVSQVSRAQSTIPGRNACCFLSGMGGGSYLIPGTR